MPKFHALKLFRSGLLLGALMLVTVGEVKAQVVVDFSKVTCRQLYTMRGADLVPIWLSGYYHGRNNDPSLDVEQLKENVRKVQAVCTLSENWQQPVMDVIAGIESKSK